MNLKKRFGKRIQELRNKRNLKQSELAELVGIATKTQSCIETGRNFPSSDLIEKYAKAFNLDIADILTINHINSEQDLYKDINTLISKANEKEIVIIHKFLKSLLN